MAFKPAPELESLSEKARKSGLSVEPRRPPTRKRARHAGPTTRTSTRRYSSTPRANIEKLIDDALESGDTDRMREALEELKRLQSPYLNWAGKAERTSFEIDTVSLHVHERMIG